MASKARKAFDENLTDIDRLVDMYESAHELIEVQGKKPLPKGYDVALRSALVLLVTCWEAYVEDIVSESVEHYSVHLSSPEKLPQSLKKSILKHLGGKGQDAYWDLSGDGWKVALTNLLKELQGKRDFNFNNPESGKTRSFIADALGIENIIESWDFDGKTPEQNAATLDTLIRIRGKIAHRAKLNNKVEVETVQVAVRFFKKLVGKTGGHISAFMRDATGAGLWS